MRPSDVVRPGDEGARKVARHRRRAPLTPQEQADRVWRTGYIANSEGCNMLAGELLRRGVPHGPAEYAAHSVAPGGLYYFRGNARTARDMHRSKRSAQRYRAELERRGLIRSRLLLRGDMVPGQRAPVRHAQVVRDVGPLWDILAELGAARAADKPRPPSSARPSVADAPRPPDAPSVPRSEGSGVAPEVIIAFHAGLVAAAKAPKNAARVVPEELDEIDRELQELDRKRPAPERAPPRGPPSHGAN